MEKKESPKEFSKEEKKESKLKTKLSGFSSRIFAVIKFVLGICLVPFVYSSSIAFLSEFSRVDKVLQNNFWGGVISFLIIYLFIYEPVIIYQKGHRLVEVIFSFFAPLVKVAPYLLPIYFIVIFAGYFVFCAAFKSKELVNYFFILFGLSLTLHLVFSAKTIRSKQEDFLKANYIFGFSFIYVVNLMLLAFCLNLALKDFSFVNFFNNSSQIAKNIFAAVFKQLFVP